VLKFEAPIHRQRQLAGSSFHMRPARQALSNRRVAALEANAAMRRGGSALKDTTWELPRRPIPKALNLPNPIFWHSRGSEPIHQDTVSISEPSGAIA
jgi:hypothetical protein